MRREEKRRKFHEALLKTLYPPPPTPTPPSQPEIDGIPASSFMEMENSVPDDDLGEENGSSESEDDGESGTRRLTRAQRKRLRQKKLREDAARRRNIIGPLLPSTSDGGGPPLDVRQNACKELGPDVTSNNPEEPFSFTKQSKMKQRRTAKKLAKNKA